MKYEIQKTTLSYKSYIIVIFFISSLTLYLLYLQSCTQFDQNYLTNALDYSKDSVIKNLHPTKAYYTSDDDNNCSGADTKFLVCSSKCRIPNIDPFNSDLEHLYSPQLYRSCSKLPLLTYTNVIDNKAVLYIDKSQILEYSDNGVNCCYKTVTRKSDSVNKVSKCKNFVDNVTLSEDIVVVKCDDSYTNKTVYKNIHAVITIHKNIEAKINNSKSSKPLSILCIGIDSVSRLNFMRLMKKTHTFIKEKEFVEFKGYNKIAENTFPNLMAIFSGMNHSTSYKTCDPFKLGNLDKCPLVFYKYQKLGYVTGYAEDEASISTFNYLKKGFINPPTDYYFRPYILATHDELKCSNLDGLHYCTGPESSGERILNLAKSFANTFSGNSYFGFFWMNSFSHNQLNSVSRMDEKFFHFFEDLWNTEVLNNTIVIFLSDHGMRFGDILHTRTGWLEVRLPMFFVRFPKWFIEDYPEEYANFKFNSNRLTTPYDVYMTLQDLLVIAGKNYTVVPSSACPKCKSLLQKIDLDRSCQDAAIDQHWCTCSGYRPIEKLNTTVQNASHYVLKEIQKVLDSFGSASLPCANFNLKNILSASISDNLNPFYKNDTYLLLVVKTKPSAVFEATVSVQNRPNNLSSIFKLEGSITRLDSYQSHSGCVKHPRLVQYCYCK